MKWIILFAVWICVAVSARTVSECDNEIHRCAYQLDSSLTSNTTYVSLCSAIESYVRCSYKVCSVKATTTELKIDLMVNALNCSLNIPRLGRSGASVSVTGGSFCLASLVLMSMVFMSGPGGWRL